MRKSDKNFVKIKADNMNSEYFSAKQLTLFDPESTLHCYYFGSLLTTVREFRTIKNCEFFSTGSLILNPKLCLENKDDKNQTCTWAQSERDGYS